MNKRGSKRHIHVTAGLIWKDGRLLIARRPKGSHLAGFWEFPGGKKETCEGLKACMEREIKEELGMDIRADRLLLTVQHEYEVKLVSLHIFGCTCLKGTPQPLEGQEIRWVDPNDLDQYAFPPPDQKVIESLLVQSRSEG